MKQNICFECVFFIANHHNNQCIDDCNMITFIISENNKECGSNCTFMSNKYSRS